MILYKRKLRHFISDLVAVFTTDGRGSLKRKYLPRNAF